MDAVTLEKETTKLEKFLKKEGRQDFIEEMRGASSEQLDSKLLGLAKHREDIRNTKDRDAEFQAARNKAKELGAPYREQLKMNEKLARYVSLIMREKEGQ